MLAPRQHIKKQRHYFVDKGPSSQSYSFPSSHVWMSYAWELELKESWASKNWCFWTVVLEKTLESSLDCKEIQPVNPKGNQFWIFIGRIDVEAETPILWPPDAKNWFIWKDPEAEKHWRWEENGMTEDETASPMQWTWIWVSSRSWWWTGKTGVLQSMGSQRVGHDWVIELNWTEHRTGGHTDFTFKGGTQNLTHTGNQGKRSNSIGAWPDIPGLRESLGKVGGGVHSYSLPWGLRHW